METPERSVKQLVSDLDFIHTEWGDTVHVDDVIRLLQAERQKREEAAEQATAEANMRAFGILNKYAMQTKSTEALDLIEMAQLEILGENK